MTERTLKTKLAEPVAYQQVHEFTAVEYALYNSNGELIKRWGHNENSPTISEGNSRVES